ncbi:shematrin-like protein 2 [Sinocyclocheilus rhinocerous]|uniref:shematrin-like protein 2 n=1 Tax=Sinocyclocheilus rhinocerous TaxID=307959 RepID=UPI0007B9AE2B|nr:PREDICTED: shematrin-like protein 2 [Sinocyclocheilus rhinocerous]
MGRKQLWSHGRGGGGGHYRAPPVHTGGSLGHSAGKVAGAAAAGALGGMLVGHGLSSMARPGYGYGHGYGGYGGYGAGYGHGHGHEGHGGEHSGDHVHNETDVDYYTDAASSGPIYSCVTVFGLVMSFLLGYILS